MRLLALLLVAGCSSPAAGEFLADLATPAEERCAEAVAIYDDLPERTAADAALVVAACM